MSAGYGLSTIPNLLTITKPAEEVGAARAPAPLHLDGADALRALATLAVVVVHTCHWPLQNSGADLRVWSWVDLGSRFCVPAFVVLSGLLLGLRGGAAEGRGRWVGRRLRRTLLPFAVWAPVYCALGLWVTGDIDGDGLAAWLLGGGGHLYFLLLVPQLYAVSLLWPRRLGPSLWLAGAAMAVQLTIDTLRLAGPMPSTLEQLALWKGYELFPFWIGYFAAGIAACSRCAATRPTTRAPRSRARRRSPRRSCSSSPSRSTGCATATSPRGRVPSCGRRWCRWCSRSPGRWSSAPRRCSAAARGCATRCAR